MTGLEIDIYKLPYVVPGLNGPDGLIREHWSKAERRKKTLYYDLLSQKSPNKLPKTKCFIIFVTYRVTLMDWDNCVASFKHIGDAMKQANIIKDDAPNVVEYMFPVQKKVGSRKEERTEIHVLEHQGRVLNVIKYILNLIEYGQCNHV